MTILQTISKRVLLSSLLSGVTMGGLLGGFIGLLLIVPLMLPRWSQRLFGFLKGRSVATVAHVKARKDLYGFRAFLVGVVLLYPILWTANATWEGFKVLRKLVQGTPADLRLIGRSWRVGDFA